MKYILLVHHNEEAFSRLSEIEQRKMREDSVKLCNQIHSEGQYLDAAPLHPSAQTTSVRVRDASGIRVCAKPRMTPDASRLGMLASICEPRRKDGTPEKLGTEIAMSR